ncbi:MAG: PilZ domain-containing protein [Deltaproteobacteria bacterium]|nr:PilZ domain-containing protein [Deltaproteobacteria bacterium]
MTDGQETDARDRRISERHNVRIRVVFDDAVNFNCAATLNLSREGALLSADIPLEKGTRVTLIPLPENEADDAALELLEFSGEVVRSFEDILVAAYAHDRFRMGIRLDLDAAQQAALTGFIEKKLQ